jgi:hypothetical protein
MEISQVPHRETVILVSHGDKTDEGNAHWLSIMQANVARLRKDPHCIQLKAIHAATVRDDWPDKRDRAGAKVRRLIQEGGRDGQILIVADRLYGAGPYQDFFKGLDYRLNEKGLSHPLPTDWLEDGISHFAQALTQPLAEAGPSAGLPYPPPHSNR